MSKITDWQLQSRSVNKDLQYLDMMFWQQAATISQSNPELLNTFGLCAKSAKLLANTEPERLSRLANPSICSWLLSADLEKLSDALLGAERLVEAEPLLAASRAIDGSAPLVTLVNAYLVALRDVALTDGDEVAQLVFGVPQLLISQLRDTSNLVIQLVSIFVDWDISLRYPSATLVELLTRSYTTHHTLIAVQAAVAATTVKAAPQKELAALRRRAQTLWTKNLNSLQANDNSIDFEPEESCTDAGECEGSRRLEYYSPRYQLAAELMRVGFGLEVLRLEVGSDVSDKVFARIRRDEAHRGVQLAKTTSRIPSGRFLAGYQLQIQASLLMLIYQRIAGERRGTSVDVRALIKSLMLLERIKVHAGMLNTYRWPPVTPSQAYGLAAEMRGGSVSGEDSYITECRECGCHFLTSVHQTGSASTNPCVYCRLEDAERINAA